MPVTNSKFEELPNEILMIIFSFITTKHLYQAFKNLNQRFNAIISDTNHFINLEEYTREEYRDIVTANEEAFPADRIVSLVVFDDKNQYSSKLTKTRAKRVGFYGVRL
jgi:hypothetical protein